MAILSATIPTASAEVLAPAWLENALRARYSGLEMREVEVVERLQTVATKIRVKLHRADAAAPIHVCIKGFLDAAADVVLFYPCSATEARFYAEMAPELPLRLAEPVHASIDPESGAGLVILKDLYQDGARFMTALEPFEVAHARQSLEQLALLHGHYTATPCRFDWVPVQLSALVASPVTTDAALQVLMDGPRSEGMPAQVKDAARLQRGLAALAVREAGWDRTVIHGDVHAGNIFETEAGLGFIDWQLLQRGSWALDIAYHIAAVLPVEVAEQHERELLRYYLDHLARAGGPRLTLDDAWAQYCEASIYGFYLWAITKRVVPEITNTFFNRLGNAVVRHESFARVGV